MLVIILVVIVAINIFLAIVGEKKNLEILGIIGTFGTLLSLTVLVCIIFLIKTKRSIECDKNEYYELKYAVEQTGGIGLEEKVLEFNDKINENRIKSQSKWVGLFYSEEVGKLPKLEYR